MRECGTRVSKPNPQTTKAVNSDIIEAGIRPHWFHHCECASLGWHTGQLSPCPSDRPVGVKKLSHGKFSHSPTSTSLWLRASESQREETNCVQFSETSNSRFKFEPSPSSTTTNITTNTPTTSRTNSIKTSRTTTLARKGTTNQSQARNQRRRGATVGWYEWIPQEWTIGDGF